jgi:hypothetical protein
MGLLNWGNALSEAGKSMQTMGLEGVKSVLEQDKIRLADELAGKRQAVTEAGLDRRSAAEIAGRLAGIERQETGATGRVGIQEEGATNRETMRLTSAETLQAKAFTNESKVLGEKFGFDKQLLNLRQTWDEGQKALDRNLTREEIAARERISGASNATALSVAKIGGAVQVDKEGGVYWVNKEGGTAPVMDPNDPKKQMMSSKDLTPSAKAYIDALKGQAVVMQNNPMLTSDQPTLDKLFAINAEILRVSTGGTGAAKGIDIGTVGNTGTATPGATTPKATESPRPPPVAAAPKTYSAADLAATVKSSGKTEAEVKAAYAANGMVFK